MKFPRKRRRMKELTRITHIKGEKPMSREQENNKATLTGEIVSDFEFNHECYGEGFYIAMLASERLSGQKDIIPIMVSEWLVDVKTDWMGRFVRVSGRFRSYNKHEGERSHLELLVFVREFEEMEFENGIPNAPDGNSIFLDGYICKKPVYRKTPLDREISDILLAVNRSYGKSDYIPCITWGRNAKFASGLEAGTRLQIEGRIQSREYQKRISDDEVETRVAYEVSIAKMEVVADEQSKD